MVREGQREVLTEMNKILPFALHLSMAVTRLASAHGRIGRTAPFKWPFSKMGALREKTTAKNKLVIPFFYKAAPLHFVMQ